MVHQVKTEPMELVDNAIVTNLPIQRIFFGKLGEETVYGTPITKELLELLKSQAKHGVVVDCTEIHQIASPVTDNFDFTINNVVCFHHDIYLDVQFYTEEHLSMFKDTEWTKRFGLVSVGEGVLENGDVKIIPKCIHRVDIHIYSDSVLKTIQSKSKHL